MLLAVPYSKYSLILPVKKQSLSANRCLHASTVSYTHGTKSDLQPRHIIYHYSFTVSSVLEVNRSARTCTDLLSKIFVPRFRSVDWSLWDFQYSYIMNRKLVWPWAMTTLAVYYISFDLQQLINTLAVFNQYFLLYYWHCNTQPGRLMPSDNDKKKKHVMQIFRVSSNGEWPSALQTVNTKGLE